MVLGNSMVGSGLGDQVKWGNPIFLWQGWVSKVEYAFPFCYYGWGWAEESRALICLLPWLGGGKVQQ